jgi:hypothetical protein
LPRFEQTSFLQNSFDRLHPISKIRPTRIASVHIRELNFIQNTSQTTYPFTIASEDVFQLSFVTFNSLG